MARSRAAPGTWVPSPDRHYDVRRVAAAFPQPPAAPRTIRLSPFPGDGDAIYFAGFDANRASAHNTAWIAQASLGAALGASP